MPPVRPFDPSRDIARPDETAGDLAKHARASIASEAARELASLVGSAAGLSVRPGSDGLAAHDGAQWAAAEFMGSTPEIAAVLVVEAQSLLALVDVCCGAPVQRRRTEPTRVDLAIGQAVFAMLAHAFDRAPDSGGPAIALTSSKAARLSGLPAGASEAICLDVEIGDARARIAIVASEGLRSRLFGSTSETAPQGSAAWRDELAARVLATPLVLEAILEQPDWRLGDVSALLANRSGEYRALRSASLSLAVDGASVFSGALGRQDGSYCVRIDVAAARADRRTNRRGRLEGTGAIMSEDAETAGDMTGRAAVDTIPVTLQAVIGSTRMTVSELLALTPGALVRLDRRVGEPVDILANGSLIGQGELAVTDDAAAQFAIRFIQRSSEAKSAA